ncbi:MAG TPA: TetR/AcrR family transcriptional regulator [Cytophagaceae bacterium]|nr:TetR/AcrR family transcriptional regulator [Cytophagaceae bacterium]
MAKNNTTKQEITDLGEELIRSRGYSAFSYHDIASQLNIKNAAIHYHFPLKEDLGVAVVKKNIEKFEELLKNPKFNKLSEWDRLNVMMDEVFGKYLTQECVCLVGALSAEYPVLPEIIQEEFQQMTSKIRAWLASLLKEGKKKKQFSFVTTPETKALMILSNMIAGLQMARVMNRSDFQTIRNGILKELKTEQS